MFRGKEIIKAATLIRSARNDASNPSVTPGVDLSLRGRQAVAISEACGRLPRFARNDIL